MPAVSPWRSMILGDAGLKADSIDTNAEVTLDQVEGGLPSLRCN
jgi:hypothetical protein